MTNEEEQMARGFCALSLTQPWATLVVNGAKRVETRSWKTPYRGWLGVHAAKGFPAWAKVLCDEEPFRSALNGQRSEELPRGALLGGVVLLDCVPTGGVELIGISEQEEAFGDYSPNRYGWLLDKATAFDEPRPMKGALGLWRIPQAVAA